MADASLDALHASVDPQASMLENSELSGMDDFATFEGAVGAGLLVTEERLNADRLSVAPAVDVIEDDVADAANSGGCDAMLVEFPEKSNRSALKDSAAGFLLGMSGPEVDERKSPKPSGETIDAGFLGGGLEAGGSKKEPPGPGPDDVKPVELLQLDSAGKFIVGFDDTGVESNLRSPNASVISLDANCDCEDEPGP